MSETGAGLALMAVFVAIGCIGALIGAGNNDYAEIAYKEVRLCEAQLPRNLKCEAVITARVVKGE